MKKYIIAAVCMVVGILGLRAGDLTGGDKAILKAAGDTLSVYQLWPGTGIREDDPLKDEEEKTTSRGILRVEKVREPAMMLFKPKKPDGRCMIVFPGGGYNFLAAEHEGVQIAKWLNGQEITVFLVKYRVPRRKGLEKHAVALQDAQRAIRIVRSRAKEFGVAPDKIGVLGFSAGGHLSILTCTQHDKDSYEPVDEHDQVSCRPDFAVPVYPAYLYAGGKLDPLVAEPKKDHVPPMFITIAADDKAFVEGATLFALEAIKAKAPVELHVYEKGGHGGGMRENAYPFSEWVKPCERWLNDLKAKQQKGE